MSNPFSNFEVIKGQPIGKIEIESNRYIGFPLTDMAAVHIDLDGHFDFDTRKFATNLFDFGDKVRGRDWSWGACGLLGWVRGLILGIGCSENGPG